MSLHHETLKHCIIIYFKFSMTSTEAAFYFYEKYEKLLKLSDINKEVYYSMSHNV